MKLCIFTLIACSAAVSAGNAQSPDSRALQNAPMPCMKSMAMPGCAQTTPPSAPIPHTHGAAALQEPENPDKHTGADLPAPELLQEVASRSAITLDDFEALADANNPTLKEARALARRAQAQARQASLYPNPTVGYEGDQIRGGAYGGGEQGGFIQQTIPLGDKLRLRREIYDQQQASNKIGVDEQSHRVHGDVEQAFYGALTAQEEVRVRRQLLDVAVDAAATVHQLANAGQADAPDILQTEVETEQAKVDYEVAQRQYLAAFSMLSARAGKPDLPVAPLKGELEKLPDLNTDQLMEQIVSGSPAVQLAEQQVAVAQARLKDTKRENVPDLQLRAGEQFNGEQVSVNPVKPVGAQSFATAGINIPLWNRNQGNIDAAKVDVEVAEQAVTQERLRVHDAAEPLVQSFLSAKFEAERFKTQLIPRAERAYQLYLDKYQQMAEAYPQVLVSQRTLFQLQISYLRALQAAWRSAVALKNYTLSGSLDAPSGSSSPRFVGPADAGGGLE